MEATEILDPEKAVERFAQLMVLEGIDPADIIIMVEKLMRRVKK